MTTKEAGIRSFRALFRFRREAGARQQELDRLAPKAGDLAPDFTLYDVEGTNAVTLSRFQGKQPVVLVFGSYT